MTIALLADTFRGPRRIRLLFSGPLASGAFSTTPYAVASADNTGPSPITVEAAYAIATDPNSVELSVSCDFTPGGLFTVTCTSVPAVDTSTFTGSITDRVSQPTTAPINKEPEASDIDLILYSRDLQWDGTDFDESVTGDLLTIAGQPNWQSAMSRRMISNGVTWDATYGAKANESVDAPDAFQPALAGKFLSQARQDNRTAQATIQYAQSPNDTNGFGFFLSITGRDGLANITITAPVPSSNA